MRQNLGDSPEVQAAFIAGLGHHGAGRLESAILAYDEVLQRDPTFLKALIGRGTAWLGLNQSALAAEDFAGAAAQEPNMPEAFYGLGQAESMAGRQEAAVAAFDRFLALRPGDPGGLKFRGGALHSLQKFEPALRDFDVFLETAPNDWSALHHRGNILTQLGRFEEGLACYRHALRIAPERAEIHCALGMGLLRIGEFYEGYAEWEWRKLAEGKRGAAPFPQPEWLGRENIAGKTLFIHAEQGLGDSLQFCRYLPRLAARGARVIFGAQDSMAALFAGFDPAVEVIGRSRPPAAFDYHCSLLSLPLALGETEPAPMAGPYVKAEPQRAARWRARIGDGGFKVGLIWRSNPTTDDSRSAPLAAFRPLAEIPGVRLIGLHRPQDERPEDGQATFVERLGQDFDAGPDAMLDAAAAMDGLDLIVSVDTSLLHLAGAMARPTFGLIKQVPDWRFGVSGRSSPWYPTLSMIRQRERDDWGSVIDELVASVRDAAR